ncbi:MAG: T9SS C-terminal target domain-containing protein [Cytophagales bacterium]|nr:MAG: T9SS C-terminal target domain-containing protein [Cytophagales bacterium]
MKKVLFVVLLSIISGITYSNVIIVDTQAPSTPRNLSPSNITQNTLTLSWEPSIDNVGVISYEVFRAGVSVGTTTSTNMFFSRLTCNTTYSFTVRAKDAAGNLSTTSSALQLKTDDCPSASTQFQAKKADDFINSIGVATHIDRSAGPYSNAANVKSQLLNLGIKHIRDQIRETNITNYTLVKDLADNGIKSTGFLQGDFNNSLWTPSWWIQQVKNMGAAYAYEAFEGPNEADLGFGFIYKGQTWPNGVREFQKDIYLTVKNDPSISDRPVLGPTIGSGFKPTWANSLGDISAYVDYGNFHYYKAWGQSYSEGFPDWDLQNVKDFHNAMFGNKPYMATEGSYQTAINGGGISELLNAKYTLRYYLEYWRLGVVRTFKYELFDGGTSNTDGEQKFGLIENDGITLKPAAIAVKDMISLLADPNPAAVFTPTTLNFTVTNADSYTHYNLLQKSNGKFYLVIWNDAPSWNDNTKTEITNNDPITLTFNQTVVEAKLYMPCTNGTALVSTNTNPTSLNITVPNHPMIYEISLNPTLSVNPGGGSGQNTTMNSNQIVVHPNPTKKELYINGNILENSTYQIFSMEGMSLYSGVLEDNTISVEHLKQGIYILKIKSSSVEREIKFIKE